MAGVWKNGTDVNGNVHGNNGNDKDDCATTDAKEKNYLYKKEENKKMTQDRA